MIKNNFKSAFRNLIKHTGFSLINIAGLTLGLTACLLIGLFVRDEKSFDQFISEGDRIYRIYYKISGDEGTSKIASTPPMFATSLQVNFPEVEKTLRVLNISSKELFEAGSRKMYEEKGIFADPSFFDLFPLSFTYGSSAKVLDDPNSIVLSSDMAKKYFGAENPVGKEILLGKDPFQVKAVFENNPKFHLFVNYILPMTATGLSEEQLQSWTTYGYHNYVKLKRGSNVQSLQTKFQNYTRPFLKGEGPTFLPFFQSLKHIHLYSADFQYDISERGNITYVKALTTIAVFILLIACFNFINLATAKSLQRAKEVGIRKTIGASRLQLVFLYIGETILLTFISIVLTALLTLLLLPSLNQFTEKHIVFDLFTNPLISVFLLLLAVLIGILAGFYPALVLSGFQPIKVLKGASQGDIGASRIPWLRHGMVVTQFSMSVILVICAIVVIRQMNYLHNKELGFDKEQLMLFPIRGENLEKNYEAFRTSLLEVPDVSSVSIGYGFPGDMFGDGLMTVVDRADQKPIKATQLMIDNTYISTLGLQLVAGRDFSKEFKTDKDASYIINETAVKDFKLGTPENALGQTLSWPTWRKPDSLKKGQIIGVVKDFHYKSLYDKVEPAVLQIYPEAYSKVAVKIKATEIEQTIARIEKVWGSFTPDYPLDYTFLDENFAKMYRADDKLKSLLWLFTAVTIFVACLGLLGLAAYAAERRKKEVGIRKVLGASIQHIVVKLSADFIRPVMVAILVASPFAWYLMKKWLENFAYRIEVGIWVFVSAGLISITIALLTVSYQAIKAALVNPVKSLRAE